MDGSGEKAVVQEVFSHGTLYEYFRLRAFIYSWQVHFNSCRPDGVKN